MTVLRAELHDRPVRVSVPVRVTFSGGSFLIREFTANLSVGGIFLRTENMVEPGVEGEGHSLLDEIRKRPIDQRLMLALQATGEEIDALIRDGHGVVIDRLLENPRVSVRHARTISRDPRLPTHTLMTLRRQQKSLDDE